jgi:hypothetical protein
MLRGRDDEILECFVASPDVEEGIDLWRVSPGGFAAHVSIHREDERVDSAGSGRRFYPNFLSLGLADIVLHACALAQRFQGVESVEFRCEWSGLRERESVGADGRLDRRTGQVARADGRTTRGQWPVGELGRSWLDVVGALGAPVLRLFDPQFDYSAELVRSHLGV